VVGDLLVHDSVIERRCYSMDTLPQVLSSLSDEAVKELLAATQPRVSIGGATQTIEIAGTPVFVKTITVPDRELDAGPGDTRNLFELPPWYHYGVGAGSTGFSAWREIAMHEMASRWVLTGASPAFPLLYHWRTLPSHSNAPRENDIAAMVAFWAGSAQIEQRLRALATAHTVAVLFLEHHEWRLRDYLDHQLRRASARDQAAAVSSTLTKLLGGIAHMQAHAVVHLDNVMTSGHHPVITDFGLAAAASFRLDDAERQFLTTHVDHVAAYCVAEITNAVVKSPDARSRNEWIHRCATTGAADNCPEHLADTVRQLAPTADVINDFYGHLHGGHLQQRYPSAELATTLAAIDQHSLRRRR
jgi:hypothetical protein